MRRVSLIAVLALLGALLAVGSQEKPGAPATSADARPTTPHLVWLPAEAADLAPLARAARRAGAGAYALSREADGAPDSWAVCTPIPVYVDRVGAPGGFAGTVRSAIATLHAATGYRFRFAGTITRGADPRDVVPPSAVTIAWTSAARMPQLAGPVVGVTGRMSVNGQILMARVALDRTLLDLPAATRGRQVHAVLLHELGHAMGLEHVTDPRELMYPTVHGQAGFAAGDLAGLKRVGLPRRCA